MVKRKVLTLLIAVFMLYPMGAMAELSLGQVLAKSKDINIKIFGSLKAYPHFIENADFNSSNTAWDWILDEQGVMEDNNVRAETRIGLKGNGDKWDFQVILESDVNLNKLNGDRGADITHRREFPLADEGMSGEDFGLEKLTFGYQFDKVYFSIGWNNKSLDMRTGGIMYGDDHPFMSLKGKFNDTTTWEALYLMIQDETIRNNGVLDGDLMDWRAYTFRVSFGLGSFTVAPMYVFSDNDAQEANVHYLGVESYGKVGKIKPRFEVIYAIGEQDIGSSDKDISAWAAHASLEFNLNKAFNPYFGGYYLTGDDDANDDDVEAFNGISCGARFAPAFGMENALVYRFVPSLGTHLYSNNFNTLGSAPGYGGISNSSKGDAPGLIMFGVGAKGVLSEKLSYKGQVMYFSFAETDALEDFYGRDIDDEVGFEFDLNFNYKINKHFTIGNTLAVFMPGDSIEDRLGEGHDEVAIMDTIELKWSF